MVFDPGDPARAMRMARAELIERGVAPTSGLVRRLDHHIEAAREQQAADNQLASIDRVYVQRVVDTAELYPSVDRGVLVALLRAIDAASPSERFLATGSKLTVREAARQRYALGGASAQALEGALQQAEREIEALRAQNDSNDRAAASRLRRVQQELDGARRAWAREIAGISSDFHYGYEVARAQWGNDEALRLFPLGNEGDDQFMETSKRFNDRPQIEIDHEILDACTHPHRSKVAPISRCYECGAFVIEKAEVAPPSETMVKLLTAVRDYIRAASPFEQELLDEYGPEEEAAGPPLVRRIERWLAVAVPPKETT